MSKEDFTYTTFIPVLLDEVPELVPLYKEHMRDNLNELLPHVFMGSVTRFVVETYHKSISGGPEAHQALGVYRRIMSIFERAAGSSSLMVVNLMTVSFCENLIPHEEKDIRAYNEIKEMMGLNLAEQMREILAFWDEYRAYK